MSLLDFFTILNSYIDTPFTLIFLCIGILLTITCGFAQFRTFRRFFELITQGPDRLTKNSSKSINPFHALFTAMASTIGIGNIIGPSLAIVIGGPGALFWLVVYAFFGSITKLVEVTFALHYKKKTADGRILGGPMEYLKAIHPLLAHWYAFATLFLFAGWSGIQAKAFAEIFARQAVPEIVSGAFLALVVFAILVGGARRVGNVASKLVPLMFVLYVGACLWILAHHPHQLLHALSSICAPAFRPAAAVGGFLGASLFAAIRQGVYKSVYITESGMGTSAIAHSFSDIERPLDQGILAMYSVAADTLLCILSGLLVLTSGIWTNGSFSSTLVFSVFEKEFPGIGTIIFILSITLFILTTAIGNSFSGGQSFASFTRYRWLNWYYFFAGIVMMLSAITDTPLVWAVMDFILPLVALPNLIGVVVLAFRHPEVLDYKKS